MLSSTRFESFLSDAHSDIDGFRERAVDDGTYVFSDSIGKIIEFSNRVNRNVMEYLFGEQLGKHLFEKFVIDFQRNLLRFLSYLHTDYKFFLIFQIKNNDELYSMA